MKPRKSLQARWMHRETSTTTRSMPFHLSSAASPAVKDDSASIFFTPVKIWLFSLSTNRLRQGYAQLAVVSSHITTFRSQLFNRNKQPSLRSLWHNIFFSLSALPLSSASQLSVVDAMLRVSTSADEVKRDRRTALTGNGRKNSPSDLGAL